MNSQHVILHSPSRLAPLDVMMKTAGCWTHVDQMVIMLIFIGQPLKWRDGIIAEKIEHVSGLGMGEGGFMKSKE